MDMKLLIFVILVVILVIAIVKKLIFVAFLVLVIGFAYYTGLAQEAISFFKVIFGLYPPPTETGFLLYLMSI